MVETIDSKSILGANSALSPEMLEHLQAALTSLRVLDDDAGPQANAILINRLERDDSLAEQDIEAITSVANRLQRFLRVAHDHIASARVPGLDSGPVTEATKRLASWLNLVRNFPGDSKQLLITGLKLMWSSERMLRFVQNDLIQRIELNAKPTAMEVPSTDQESKDEPEIPKAKKERQKPRGRTANPQHSQWYDTIKKSIPYLGSWKAAVAAFSQEQGKPYTVEQVKQWGKRVRKRKQANADQAA